jgi:hypothetical protein
MRREVAVELRRFARRSLRDVGRLEVELQVDTRNARGRPVALRARAVARRL